MPRTYDEHVRNLQALSAQDSPHPGYLSVQTVATMLEVRDELITNLKRVIEDDVRARRQEARAARTGR